MNSSTPLKLLRVRIGRLLLLALVTLPPLIYVEACCPFAWEHRLSEFQPSVRLRLYRDTPEFSLDYDGVAPNTRFVVADSYAALKRWADSSEPGVALPPGQKQEDTHLVECTKVKLPLVNEKGKFGDLNCSTEDKGATLHISVTRDPSKQTPDELKKISSDTYVWVAPFTEGAVAAGASSIIRQFPTRILWTGYRDDGKKVDVKPGACSPEATNAECQLVRSILGNPTRVRLHDPHALVVSAARITADYVVPVGILMMMAINSVLGVFVVGMLGYLFTQGGLKIPSPQAAAGQVGKVPQIILVDSLYLWRRRTLEFLETAGPGMGFLMTVGALLLAFESNVLVNGDTAGFSNALAMAMAATFAGLLMRVLAFSADRLFDYGIRTSKQVNSLGIVEDDGASAPNAGSPPSTKGKI